jgi:basic membrane protein A and related proteins
MRRDRPGTVLTTLVFTDIVGSTQIAEELGDRRWRELLARHNRIVRDGLRENGGRELDTAGDGVFARFGSPASAIDFAAATGDALRELGVEIRAGIHIGECEVLEGKLSGVNVHAAARTMSLAGAGEILVTGSVRDLVRGRGFGFADRGVHELRGIEGEWRLFEVTSVEDSPRSPPLPEDEARARRSSIEPPPLVRRQRVRLGAIAVAAVLLLAAAAFGLAHAVGGASAAPLTGCELASSDNLNDHSFNQAVYDGLSAASTKWGVGVKDKLGGSVAEWKQGMSELIRQKCGLIVTVGQFNGPPTAAAARESPKTRFATTDTPGSRGTSNLLSIKFDPSGAAFLAGYLAAGMTKTGTVGTFGAIPIPTVIPFMDGFAAGILYYNRVHGTHVRLLGWNPRTRTGTFVGQGPRDINAFLDRVTPATYTRALIGSGADVIFPVDGPNGASGACRAALQAKGVLLVGVDTDQYYATPDCSARWLTSVLKVYGQMVYDAMEQVVAHTFRGGVLIGTLADGGVDLGPFHDLGSRIPLRIQTELARIRRGIANRSIPVDPRTYLGT